jgi:hypothetical protein
MVRGAASARNRRDSALRPRRYTRSMRCQCGPRCSAAFAYAPDTQQFAAIAASALSKLQAALSIQPLALRGFPSKDSMFAAISNQNASECSTVALAAVFDASGGYQILISDSDVSVSATQ